MTRQALQSGGWFDISRAERFTEGSRHDGRNFISLATGDQWEHEALYRTAGGAWVLRHWSDWQGSGETWDCVTHTEAAAWLIRNGRDLTDHLVVIAAKSEV